MPKDLKEKLDRLSAFVLRDAHKTRDTIMEQTETEYNERLDEKETELLENAYNKIQKNIRSMNKDMGERILHAEMDAKKQLILKREEIIGEVMSAARERLAEFTASQEYEKWLLDKTAAALKEIGGGKKTAYLSSEDMKFKDKIESLSEELTAAQSDDSGLHGGVRVVNEDRRMASDYTFKVLLDEAKQKFLRESGLTLE